MERIAATDARVSLDEACARATCTRVALRKIVWSTRTSAISVAIVA